MDLAWVSPLLAPCWFLRLCDWLGRMVRVVLCSSACFLISLKYSGVFPFSSHRGTDRSSDTEQVFRLLRILEETEAKWGKMRTELSSGTLGHRRNASNLIYFTFLIVVCPDHSSLRPLSMEQKSLVKWTLCWVGKCLRLTLTLWEGNFFQYECEVGWPFHTELGMGNLLPFYQPPCPLLRTKKGRFRPWAATLTSLHQPQCPAPEHRESKH